MTGYAKAWEKYIMERMMTGVLSEEDLTDHLLRLEWMQDNLQEKHD